LLPPPSQITSIFAALTEAPTRQDKTDVVEMRNRLKKLNRIRKEKGKEKMPKESSLVIMERLNQIMLSNPLESFLRDLGKLEDPHDHVALKG